MKQLAYLMTTVLTTFLTSTTFLALAQAGGAGPGGGTGCKGIFMRSAYVTSQWLEIHGSTLKPSISAEDFLLEINPDGIIEIPVNENLKDKNDQPVTAYFDGANIKVRCDRLKSESTEGLQRVVAHEIFRKMRVEGDLYEISRQIWPEISPKKGPTPFPKLCREYTPEEINPGFRFYTVEACVDDDNGVPEGIDASTCSIVSYPLLGIDRKADESICHQEIEQMNKSGNFNVGTAIFAKGVTRTLNLDTYNIVKEKIRLCLNCVGSRKTTERTITRPRSDAEIEAAILEYGRAGRF